METNIEPKYSVMKLIKGFEIIERKTRHKKLKDGTEQIKIVETTRHIPPDMDIIELILLNQGRPKSVKKQMQRLVRAKYKALGLS